MLWIAGMMRKRAFRIRSRTKWGIIGAVALLIVSALIALLIIRPSGTLETNDATTSPAPTPAPSATLELSSFYAPATFTGWTRSAEADPGLQFSVDGEGGADGAVALRLDSTTVREGVHGQLQQMIPVSPETEYTFSAAVKSPDDGQYAGVKFTMGSSGAEFALPQGEPDWQNVSWSYATGPGETSLPIAISASGPVRGFGFDQLSLTSGSGAVDTIQNPSFEAFETSTGLVSPSLVLTTGEAAVDYAWFTRSVDWAVVDGQGNPVANGIQATNGGIASIPLQDLGQGYYSLTLSAQEGSNPPFETAFMVLNASQDGHAVSDPRFGIAGHIDQHHNDGAEVVAAQIGITGVRTDARWNVIEKAKGQYNFVDQYNVPFAAFEAQGISVLPLSNGKNKLYDRGRLPHSVEGIQAYADYTAAMVDHFDAEAVEIHNELNQTRFNDGDCGITADCYFPLLKASAEAVRAKNPGALIVGPANANQDDPWLTELYRLGGLNYLDAISYHPYPETPEPLVADIKQAVARIKEFNNGVAKPIWLTEFGWTSSTSGAVSEQTQADYLVRAEAIAFANGVEKAFWYDLVNDDTDPTDHEGNFGLFRQKSATNPTFEPKPAAAAQAVLIRKIEHKAFTRDESLDGPTYTYVFGDAGSETRIAWATSPSTVTYATDVPLTVTSSTGTVSQVAPVGGNVSLELGESPIYVEGATTAASPGNGG